VCSRFPAVASCQTFWDSVPHSIAHIPEHKVCLGFDIPGVRIMHSTFRHAPVRLLFFHVDRG
jgi:hypothetical protein